MSGAKRELEDTDGGASRREGKGAGSADAPPSDDGPHGDVEIGRDLEELEKQGGARAGSGPRDAHLDEDDRHRDDDLRPDTADEAEA